MTAEFISSEKQAEETGTQEIFGIKLTPQVKAIGIAVLGLLVAGGIGYQFVLQNSKKAANSSKKLPKASKRNSNCKLKFKKRQKQKQSKKKQNSAGPT